MFYLSWFVKLLKTKTFFCILLCVIVSEHVYSDFT